MNRSTIRRKSPHKLSARRLMHEYIEIIKTTRISIVDVISWFCAAACIIATLYCL